MAAHVLRLRLALLFGTLRGDAWHVVRMVGGLVLLAAATGAACWAMLTLRDASTAAMLAVTVLGGSAVTLGFALAPLFAAVDDPLDPRRFALFGLAWGRLAAVLALVGLISVPILCLLAIAVCAAIRSARPMATPTRLPPSRHLRTPRRVLARTSGPKPR